MRAASTISRPARRPTRAGKNGWLALLLVSLSPPGFTFGSTPDEDWFVERVQPILERRCLSCHSHRAGKMQGGLTLDSRSGWSTGGDSGPAVVPHQPDKSLLIQAVRRQSLEMPPDERLPEAEVATLVEWVQRGAADPRQPPVTAAKLADTDWWSLRPLRLPPLPAHSPPVPATSPIDLWLQERLARESLVPAPPADRRILLRRVMYDLHGLPPSPEEVAEFVADSDPWAYEKRVDQLLASPRYGERWARHWFDTIHFAETHGYEHDVARPHAWRYRDYVVAALNRDVPWDRFIREQLAADAFYPDEPDRLAGLGFLGAGTFDLSTFSTAPVTFDYLDRDDLVTQTLAAFASTTANCARCHDHKFDPVSQEDYYALQAVFAGISKGDLSFDSDPQVGTARRRWQQLLDAAQRRDAAEVLSSDSRALADRWEREQAGQITAWQLLDLQTMTSAQGAELRRQEDGSVLSAGPRPETDVYTVTARIPLPTVTALRLEVLADDALPMKGPGRQENGNLHLNEIEIQAATVGEATPRKLKIRSATADFDQQGWTIQHAIDGNPATAWGIYPQVGRSHLAVFELAAPLQTTAETTLTIALHQVHGRGHLIGRLRLAVTAAAAAQAVAIPADVEAALRTAPRDRTPEQALAVSSYALQQLATAELARLPSPAKVYAAGAAVERDNNVVRLAEPKVVHVLTRGDIARPGAVAPPGALSALSPLPGRFALPPQAPEAARRAALADWLAHPDNPLTWRSIANRVWHYHFGRGICDSPSDLGRMGGEPTHPELLDWLAATLRAEQGSLKQLHRRIVLSDAYRRASQLPPALAPLATRDPDNRWIGRMLRQRLDAESYRDAVLAVSGRLDLTIGGPSIQHFKTSPGAQLTPKLDYDAYAWDGPGAGRRSLYRFVWRGIADPFMEALDFPDAALLQPARGNSASALQALALYNNDFVLRHSQYFADRLTRTNADDDARVREAARLVWLREPTAAERDALATYARQHGWPALCRVLINSSEFLFVE